jgi:hypothetical protein
MDYILKLSQQDVQVIINALGELPLKISANTFGSIQRQVQEQDAVNAIDLGKVESNA